MGKKIFLTGAILITTALVFSAQKAEAGVNNKLRLRNAVITAIDTETKTITAEKNDVSYVIDASKAIFKRKYGARCDIYELMVGDYIRVWGVISGTNITAIKVKDYSIQRWRGSFVGTITTIDSEIYSDNKGQTFRQFEIKSHYRGNQIIRVYDTTQIKYKRTSKAFTDLAIGQKIVAKGIWNNTQSLVYNTKWVKIKKLVE